MDYHRRIVDDILYEMIDTDSLINIAGPSRCGKTATCERFAETVLPFKSHFKQYKMLSELEPELLLDNREPILFDDVNLIPIYEEVLENEKDNVRPGSFILTNGENTANTVKMYPMSLFESGESSGDIKILDLFDGLYEKVDGHVSALSIKELISAACRGGWPESLEDDNFMKDYLENLIFKVTFEKSSYSSLRVMRRYEILKLYSKYMFENITHRKLMDEAAEVHPGISYSNYHKTVNDLKNVHLIEEIKNWDINIKSHSVVYSKRCFIDPSIPVLLQDLSPGDLLLDLEKFEAIFKTLCIRDLRVYTSPRRGEITHISHTAGDDVDCVLSLDNGDYALINFNLGNYNLDKDLKILLKTRRAIMRKIRNGEIPDIGNPKFLAVITATKFAYTTENNIHILPIGLLR